MKHFNIYLVFFLFLSISFGGCMEESISGRENIDNEVTVIIKMPGPSRGNTRAITQGGDADNAVTRVDILMFDAITKLYTGRIYSNTITGTGNIKTFTVRMPRGNYDVMVLANAKEIVDAAALVVGTTPKTGTATSADRLLVASLPGRPTDPFVIRQWNANPSSPDFKPFPMWGEVSNFTPETSGGTMTVNLIRALAKINIRFANQVARDKLAINRVSLFNFNSGGYLVSRGYNQNATNVSQHAPDALTTSSSHGYSNAMPYAAATGLNVSVDEIFLFDVSAAASAANRTDAVALMIGGYYDGSSTLSYYRIDMMDSSGNYFDIIRNHYYDIMITAINGPGYSDATEASNAKPFNILTQINAWNESGMNNHTYDGRHQLTVDFNNFTFNNIGSPSQSLRIYTDAPTGWTIEVPIASNWISVTPTSYNNSVIPFTSTTVQITCGPNSGTNSRTGSFFIVAGALRKEITVSQSAN
ncbi:MAG: FimB/Mfa2 family fimbrial subunit [Dysgonamonadaceae bacterium]|nr:FimB/Mfa2 family fimbrial subunit [Dysgonamonadaceae bacterium]